MIRSLSTLLVAILVASPASAAERRYTVTDFDRILVEGPMRVSVITGKPPSAVAEGSPQALDRVSIDVQGRTLRIRQNRSAWGGYPGEQTGPSHIRVTTHGLRAATVNGAGMVAIDRVKAMRLDLSLAGSGSLELGSVDADIVSLGLVGSGRMLVGGKAKTANAVIQGSGDLDAGALVAEDATVTSESAGVITLGARRSAKVNSGGSGDVTILGTPACTIVARGSGRIACGR